MVVTGGICNYNLESTAKDLSRPENLTPGAGVRVVEVSDEVSPSTVTKTPLGGADKEDSSCSSNQSSSNSDCKESHFLGCTHRYEVV